MRKVKSSGTKPELLLRDALRARGIVIDDNLASLPGKPDIVIPEDKVAIFVDGDFWHGNQWKIRGLSSIEDQFTNPDNKEYWIKKINRNVIRDSRVSYDLMESGWVVIRLWESQIEDNLDSCVELILEKARTRLLDDKIKLIAEKSFSEFFAGIGLMRLALEKRGWNCKFANDIDPDKQKMYEDQFGQEDFFSPEDIHKLDVDSVPSTTLATASFPCNDLSLAGARQGLNEGKQSSAFWGFIRIIQEMGLRKPPLILLENVPGFLSSKGGEDFYQALKTLNELGYRVDSFLLDAANFVPQSRKRLFVVGIDKAFSTSANFTLDTSDVRSAPLRKFIATHQDIDWAIRNLPSSPKQNKYLASIIENVSEDSHEWWSEERAAYLLGQMSEKHKIKMQEMISGSEITYATAFRRVRNGKTFAEIRNDGIAGCLRTPRGGSGRQILIQAGQGNYRVRLLNPRECAKLMGADDFTITVNLNQALFGFGDAVCVPVIEWIMEHYFNPLVNEILHVNLSETGDA